MRPNLISPKASQIIVSLGREGITEEESYMLLKTFSEKCDANDFIAVLSRNSDLNFFPNWQDANGDDIENPNKIEIIESFLKNNTFSMENVASIIVTAHFCDFIKSGEMMQFAISEFFSKSQYQSDPSNFLRDLNAAELTPENKFYFARGFVNSSTLAPKDFVDFLEKLKFSEELDQKLISTFLSKNIPSPDDFLLILGAAKIGKYNLLGRVYDLFQGINKNPDITLNDFLGFLKASIASYPKLNSDPNYTDQIIENFVMSRREIEELIKIFPMLRFSEKSKSDIITQFLTRPKNLNRFSAQEIEKVLETVKFNDWKLRSKIITYFLSRNSCDIDDFTRLVNTFLPESGMQKDCLEKFFRDSYDPNSRSVQQAVEDISRWGNFKYESISAVVFLATKNSDPQFIIDFALALYPQSTAFQSEFLEAALSGNNSFTKENLRRLNLQNLSDDVALEFITKARSRNLVDDLGVLHLCANHISTRFSSLAPLLSSTSKDVVTGAAAKELDKLFGKSWRDMPAGALLSYYQVTTGNVGRFSSLLKEAFRQKIAINFRPNSLIISPQELTTFGALTGVSAPEFVSGKLVPVSNLCDKFTDLEPLQATTEKFDVNFVESAFPDEEKGKIQDAINTIMSSSNPVKRNDAILNLFQSLTGAPIAEDEKLKLNEVFNYLKPQITHLLQQKGGIDILAASLTTLSHGCINNISSQLNLAVSMALLADKGLAEQNLYLALNDVISQILSDPNQGDLIGVNPNPLNNQRIREFCISPNHFLELLSQNLLKSVRQIWTGENDRPCLMEELFGEGWQDICDYISAKNPAGEFNEISAKLAAYLIIKQFLPREVGKITDAEKYEEYLISPETSAASPANSPQNLDPKTYITISKKEFLEFVQKELGLDQKVIIFHSKLPGKSLESIAKKSFPNQTGKKLQDGGFDISEDSFGKFKSSLAEFLPQKYSASIANLTFEKLSSSYSIDRENVMI